MIRERLRRAALVLLDTEHDDRDWEMLESENADLHFQLEQAAKAIAARAAEGKQAREELVQERAASVADRNRLLSDHGVILQKVHTDRAEAGRRLKTAQQVAEVATASNNLLRIQLETAEKAVKDADLLSCLGGLKEIVAAIDRLVPPHDALGPHDGGRIQAVATVPQLRNIRNMATRALQNDAAFKRDEQLRQNEPPPTATADEYQRLLTLLKPKQGERLADAIFRQWAGWAGLQPALDQIGEMLDKDVKFTTTGVVDEVRNRLDSLADADRRVAKAERGTAVAFGYAYLFRKALQSLLGHAVADQQFITQTFEWPKGLNTKVGPSLDVLMRECFGLTREAGESDQSFREKVTCFLPATLFL